MSRLRFRFSFRPSLPGPLNIAFDIPFTNADVHLYWDAPPSRSGWWRVKNACGGEIHMGRVVAVYGFDNAVHPIELDYGFSDDLQPARLDVANV